MAADMFLKIDGIEGESQDDDHINEIDVLSWSWGMSQSGDLHLRRGPDDGVANIDNFSFTKLVDRSTTDLMMALCTGQPIVKAKLICRKIAGGVPLEYLKIKFENVFITSLSTGGSGGDDQLTEHVTLSFAKVFVEYAKQSTIGGAAATPKMGWDITTNSPL